jgi:hypothetical protein
MTKSAPTASFTLAKEEKMEPINVAIIGVGNCARMPKKMNSSLA